MTDFFFYLVLLNALIAGIAGIAVFRKNRHQSAGPLLGLTMAVLSLWLFGFAHYFRPLPEPAALSWAQFTLGTAILYLPFFFHCTCAYLERVPQFRGWIVACYVSCAAMLAVLLTGNLVVGIRPTPYMDHYIRYNRTAYPFFGAYLILWQGFAAALIGYHALRATGYKRVQYVYFVVAWFIASLTTNSIIIPLEYDINLPPFGFFILPINFAFLAYVVSTARLADFNVAIARVLLQVLTLLIVAAASLLFVAGIRWIAPGFMNVTQMVFTVVLVVFIGVVLTAFLPRWLPRVERVMQERMFGGRFGYQDALAGLVKEIARLPSLDDVLQTAASTVHSKMHVSRVFVLLQDPLSGCFGLRAQSGLPLDASTDGLGLGEDSALVAWLRQSKDVLVRDEIARTTSAEIGSVIFSEMDRLRVDVCVPMTTDHHITGVLCIGSKLNQEMFFVSDLRVLETLATELALAVKYRRMEDQISRKNKLIELGTIAAGVAHEIRNPLASIRTFAQLLPDKMDDPEFKNEFSKLVLKDVDRITKVVESMLAFARPGQVQVAEHKATDLVEEAILLAQPRIKGKRIEISREYHDQPVLRVDKQQILQVLINLLNNAADALPDHGKIRVATGVRAMEGGNGSDAERFGVIEVADNGPGMPPQVRNRLFDPFFTTKKDGTGLGLSISQKIARDHGGVITVSSVEGKGTTFQVNLPLLS